MDFAFHEETFLKDLQAVLRIRSVNGDCGPITPTAPLGQGICDALEFFLTLGKQFGFRTKNVDGYCAWIEMGEGAEMAAILAHVDTVSSDEGWTYPPFDATLVDSRIYGRGASDDKGPALVALYAMKAVQDSGRKLNKRIRLILGGDEEGGDWRCMKRYRQTEELPSCAFTPDAAYPVTYAEKGILNLRLSAVFGPETAPLVLSSGHTINVVPAYAEAIVNGERFTAQGKAAHASTPELGVNAMRKLCNALQERGICHPLVQLAAVLDAKGLGVDCSDAPSGMLTINPAITRCDAKEATVDCDLRIPVTVNKQQIIDEIAAHIKPFGFCAQELLWEGPLYVEKDSPLVMTLQKVYRECTGDAREPVSTGGGTYARAFQNAVAFGALLPDDEHTYHETNEYWSLESIRKNFQILTHAILAISLF